MEVELNLSCIMGSVLMMNAISKMELKFVDGLQLSGVINK